jgi:hypothetical protein
MGAWWRIDSPSHGFDKWRVSLHSLSKEFESELDYTLPAAACKAILAAWGKMKESSK